MDLNATFEELFTLLDSRGYTWEPQIPEKLVQLRRSPWGFTPLQQYFGLGIPVPVSDLHYSGFTSDLCNRIHPLDIAISQINQWWIPHHHWPAKKDEASEYVHFGRESVSLIRSLQLRGLQTFHDKKVLDLGCSSGSLSFAVANHAREVLGVDCSHQAIQWAKAAGAAQKLHHVNFMQIEVGKKSQEAQVPALSWDQVLMNPPLVVNESGAFTPHRDGGKYGIEMAHCFLDFAWRCLRKGGEVLGTVSNPIVQGKGMFFDQLDGKKWTIRETKVLDPRFNHQLYRKEHYSYLGIQRVELHFLNLVKKG